MSIGTIARHCPQMMLDVRGPMQRLLLVCLSYLAGPHLQIAHTLWVVIWLQVVPWEEWCHFVIPQPWA
jgi:hypothetical protein